MFLARLRILIRFLKSSYYSIFDDYGVDADKIWTNNYWFCVTAYGTFGNGRKTVPRSPVDNLTQWRINQFKGFTRKDIGKVGRYVRKHTHLDLTS